MFADSADVVTTSGISCLSWNRCPALILATTHFHFRGDLQTVERYQKLYNEHLPQRALDHKTPRRRRVPGAKKATGAVRQKTEEPGGARELISHAPFFDLDPVLLPING